MEKTKAIQHGQAHRLALGLDGWPMNPFPYPINVFKGERGGIRYECRGYRSTDYEKPDQLVAAARSRFPFAAIVGNGLVKDQDAPAS